jgi:23S rRNA pseudouridine1911/1915/1917 synthase
MSSKIAVIFEDQDLLILHKPAGVVVNRAQTVTTQTVQDWIEQNYPSVAQQEYPSDWRDQIPESFTGEYGNPEEIFASRSGIAHRLDKDTSGVFVCVKHPGALLSLLAQFRQRTIQKRYTCLVHGKFALSEGEVNAPIGRRSSNRKLFAVVPDGRASLTKYKVQKYYQQFDQQKLYDTTGLKKLRVGIYQGFSLVSCWPKTGRTHQIRVHMAHLQHPLVGDEKYVGRKRAKLDVLWCPRQFLHAAEISFTHPRTGKSVSYEAPLSDDLQTALEFVSAGK